MPYVKQTEEEKQLKRTIAKLKKMQRSGMWASLMRAICYPHKGMMYSHTYVLTEWYRHLVRRGETETFFKWAEGYRAHCDALPITRKGGRAKEISTAWLFTEEMFQSILEKCEADTETAEFKAVSQFLAPLLPIDVYLPKEYCPTLDDIIEVYQSIATDSAVVGILTQKEDRPFVREARNDPKWKQSDYVFSDPLNPEPNWDTFPQNYDEMLLMRIQELDSQVRKLAELRTTKPEVLEQSGRPCSAGTEGETGQTQDDPV